MLLIPVCVTDMKPGQVLFLEKPVLLSIIPVGSVSKYIMHGNELLMTE